MKVLYDLIRESDPEELWKSLNLTTQYLTHEGVDAFLEVYQRVLAVKPEYIPLVLEKVEAVKPGKRVSFMALEQGMPVRLERVPVRGSNLEKVLSLHVPSVLYDVCRTTVINELFRCLITEELEKPRYKYKLLRRRMVDEIDHCHEVWTDRCAHNLRELEEARKKYEEQELHRNIRKECREKLPEMGRSYYWDELIGEAGFTESFCKALLPANPPSLARLDEVKNIIVNEIKRASDISENDDESDWTDERFLVRRRLKLMLEDSRTIIVGKNNIPGMRIPIIYKVDSEGRREEIQPADLENPLMFTIVIQDKRLENDLAEAVGYILLYLAYPLRMRRVMKAYQVQEIVNLLSR